MNKYLYRRLIKIALLSTPIIALYGVTPIYLFNKIPAIFFLFAGTALTINVFILWIGNIGIIALLEKKVVVWKWYMLSYAYGLVTHFTFFLLRNKIKPPSFIENIDNTLKIDKVTLIAYPLIAILAINTIIIIICNAVLANHKNKNAELEIQELKVTNLEAQKQVLMQQLQPHFLFNTLSVLKSLIKENPEDAENYSIKLSEFLRYSIEIHKSDLVSVEQELKFTNDYIDLQKVRFEHSLICEINLPNDILSMKIPAYALQSLVENAIKHNSFTEKKPLYIKISCADETIKVWNNKMLNKHIETSGTGLKNLNQRYKLITNKEIVVNDGEEDFSVSVHILNGK